MDNRIYPQSYENQSNQGSPNPLNVSGTLPLSNTGSLGPSSMTNSPAPGSVDGAPSPSPPPSAPGINTGSAPTLKKTMTFSSPLSNEDYSTSNTHAEEEHIVEFCPNNRYAKLNVILGKGAYKVVWKALDMEEGLEVAWNSFQVRDGFPIRREETNDSFRSTGQPQPTTKQESADLSQEIEILKKVRHPNIIGFKDSWYQNGEFVFITELMNSGTLREYTQKLKIPNMKIIKHWTRQILKGLLYLHSHNPPIIHRDIKCDNIFINGAHGEVKIGDMGTAKMKFGKKYTVIGTPEFMAPEMYEEKGYNEKVDVYAFGMCLLELATGDYPYSECKNAAQIYKKVSSGIKPECLSSIEDETLLSLIHSCIAPEAERLSVRQIFDHPFYVCEPDVILLAVDDLRYVLTLQVVFRGQDRISVKFEYGLDCDTPEEVVNEMIQEKVLQEKYKSHVITEINRILREFHQKFPFALEAIQHQQRSKNHSPETSMENISFHRGTSTMTPFQENRTGERMVYHVRHSSAQHDTADHPLSLSPSNLSWKRESQYKTEMNQMQKEVQKAHERAVEAELRARDLEAKINPKPAEELSHTTLSPVPLDLSAVTSDTLIEELVHEVAAGAHRGPDKASEWVFRLHAQDIMTVGDLKALHEEDWNNLNLTVFACRALKNAISGKGTKMTRTIVNSPPMATHEPM